MARRKIENRELIPRYIRGRVLDDCHGVCAHCGNKLDFYEDFTLEHVIPLSKGGTNEYENFVALCEDCNKAKSNDIIQPLEYYPYLEPDKRMQLHELFQTYIRSVDWLSNDNLFMLDWFYIHPKKTILMPKSWKPCFLPIELKVEKMRNDEAFAYLQDFKLHLSRTDQELIIKEMSLIDTYYYKILQGDKILMIFTAYILPDKLDEQYQWDHVLNLDIFISPDVPCNIVTTIPTFYNILQEILQKIQETLMNGTHGTAIPVRIRSPKSGPMINHLHRFFHCIGRGNFEFHEWNEAEGAAIAVIQFIMFQGNYQELQSIMKKHNASTFAELEAKLNRKEIQEPITKRLETTKRENA